MTSTQSHLCETGLACQCQQAVAGGLQSPCCATRMAFSVPDVRLGGLALRQLQPGPRLAGRRLAYHRGANRPAGPTTAREHSRLHRPAGIMPPAPERLILLTFPAELTTIVIGVALRGRGASRAELGALSCCPTRASAWRLRTTCMWRAISHAVLIVAQGFVFARSCRVRSTRRAASPAAPRRMWAARSRAGHAGLHRRHAAAFCGRRKPAVRLRSLRQVYLHALGMALCSPRCCWCSATYDAIPPHRRLQDRADRHAGSPS